MADLLSDFTIIRDMRFVPINKKTPVTLAVVAGLPMGLIVLFVTPTDELIRAVLKMLG